MLNRRKFFALIAGAVAVPKALLAAPLRMKLRQPGITAPNGCGGYPGGDGEEITIEKLQAAYAQATFCGSKMGRVFWSESMQQPVMYAIPDEFFFAPSPRMNFKITGITTKDEDTNGN
jgi:hypothetical protein